MTRSHSIFGRELHYLAELLALTGFVFVQPLLDVIGRAPDFLLFRQADRVDILGFVILLAAGPPLALVAVELAVQAINGTARRWLHQAFVAVLLALLALQVLKQVVGIRGALLAIAALTLGTGAIVAYVRRETVRVWIRYASPAPLVFVLLFVFMSPASALVRPSGAGVEALAASSARAPLVMIVFDEFPLMSLLDSQGEVDDRVFPNFARLGQTSTTYRNATAVSAFTPFAVPSMLTGRYPRERLAPSFSQYPENLFTLLAESHELKVFESLTGLCPESLCGETQALVGGRTGLRALAADSYRVWRRIVALDDVDEDPTGAWLRDETVAERARRLGEGEDVPESDAIWFRQGHQGENQPARFQEFVESVDGEGRPFHFLHLMLPHSPRRYLPSGVIYQHHRFGLSGENRNDEAWPALVDHQRHLLQVAYVDHLLGEVLDRLEEVNLFDRSMVVVTADHGISFLPGYVTRTFEEPKAPEIAWVPLFIKAPHQEEGTVNDSNVMLVDLVPTIGEVMGVDIPWETDGISLASDERTDDRKVFFNNPGTPIEFSASDHRAAILSGSTDRIARPEDGIEGLFKVGPFADLIGTAVADHDGDTGAGVVTLDGPDHYEAVDIRSGVVPAFVSGQVIEAAGDAPGAVAIAVNGVIGGVSETFAEGDQPMKFAAMVPPSLFVDGPNEVAVYEIVESDTSTTLSRLAIRRE